MFNQEDGQERAGQAWKLNNKGCRKLLENVVRKSVTYSGFSQMDHLSLSDV
jgi:hypothetical protein